MTQTAKKAQETNDNRYQHPLTSRWRGTSKSESPRNEHAGTSEGSKELSAARVEEAWGRRKGIKWICGLVFDSKCVEKVWNVLKAKDDGHSVLALEGRKKRREQEKTAMECLRAPQKSHLWQLGLACAWRNDIVWVCAGEDLAVCMCQVYVCEQARKIQDESRSTPPIPKIQSLQDYSNKPLHTGWLHLESCKSKAKISNIDLEPLMENVPYTSLLTLICQQSGTHIGL